MLLIPHQVISVRNTKVDYMMDLRVLLCYIIILMIDIVLLEILDMILYAGGGTRWRRWLRHCATSQKVAGSMLSLKFFIDIILPACTMALGSTQPLTEMSTRNTSWG